MGELETIYAKQTNQFKFDYDFLEKTKTIKGFNTL